MACPMCSGTDYAKDCTAGQCAFQAQIEAMGEVNETPAGEPIPIVGDAAVPLEDRAGWPFEDEF